jgi:hypothetical protein
MAEPTCPPSEWVGQDVHLECKAGAETRTNDCTPDGVNDRGVYVSGRPKLVLPLDQRRADRIRTQARHGYPHYAGPLIGPRLLLALALDNPPLGGVAVASPAA